MEYGMLIYLGVGLITGGAIGYLIAVVGRKKPEGSLDADKLKLELNLERERFEALQADLKRINEEWQKERQNVVNLNSRNATLEADLRNLQEKLNDQKKEVSDLQGRFASEFKNLANDIFEEKTKKFTDQNKNNLGELLSPLKERIEKFEQKVETSSKESLQWNSALREQLNHIKELNKQMTIDAENLTRALKGDSKAQGNWGEIQLESVLEKVGLAKNVHYFKEQTFKTEDGNNQRLDYIIKLPDDKCLVIDSKVSLTAYTRFIEEEEAEKKSGFLKQHMTSVYNHIKLLGEKNYQNLYQIKQPDYVMMFIANEPALTIAFQEDDKLYEKALDKNIVLVSTSTLLATLRTVSYIWKQDDQGKNAIEIARQAGNMYDKFVNFVEDLVKVGTNLKTTQTNYEAAMNKLTTGTGNLVGRAEKLRNLGAKSSKQIDQRIVSRSSPEEENQGQKEASGDQRNLFAN